MPDQAETLINEEMLDHVADQLAERGWVVVDDLLPLPLVQNLRDDLTARLSAFQAAGVGRDGDHVQASEVRRDKTLWLDADTPATSDFFQVLGTLRQEVNRRLMLGVFQVEAHYAIYEPGDFYKRHKDSFRGARNRILSLVFYLNETWIEDDGGQLALYTDENQATPVEVVLPLGGRCVLFLSEDIPHEVLPSQRHRFSIAAWMRPSR